MNKNLEKFLDHLVSFALGAFAAIFLLQGQRVAAAGTLVLFIVLAVSLKDRE